MMRGLSAGMAVLGAVLLLAFGITVGLVGEIPPVVYGMGGVGAVLVGVWVWLDRDLFMGIRTSGSGRFSALAWVSVLVAFSLMVVANLLAKRHDHRFDLTEARAYSLSGQTLTVLGGITSPVELVAFFPTGGTEESRFKDLISSYQSAGAPLSVSTFDPLRDPLKADEYKVTSQVGTVIMLSGDQQQRVEGDHSEEALTNALVRLTSDTEHRICLVTGHRELDPEDDYTPSGIGAVVTKLEGQNYRVDKINLAKDPIPSACQVVVLADPQRDPMPHERESMARWVAQGNDLVVMLDPGHAPMLAADLLRYGVVVGDNIVVEQNPDAMVAGMDPSYIVVEDFDHHPVTNGLKGMVVFRVARSVSRHQTAGFQTQALMHTSVHGWGEVTLDMSRDMAPDPGEDVLGPVPLVVVSEMVSPDALTVGPATPATPAAFDDVATAVQDEEHLVPTASPTEFVTAAGGRIVVVGDSDFVSNELVDQLGNADLFLNIVSWLVGEEDQLAIRAKRGEGATLTLTLTQSLVIWLLSVLVAPGAAVAGAVVTWRSRRGL